MIRFYKTPWFTRVWYPALVWDVPSNDSIYLTFDDGPHPKVTPWVMQQLESVQAKATFFCLGENLLKNNNVAKDLTDAGHVIANHTQNHLNGWEVPSWNYLEDIRACDAELMKLGVDNQLFRPPFGRIKKNQIIGLKNRKIIMWSYLSWDFDPKLDIKKSIQKLKNAEPGSILAFHDSVKAFDNLKTILPEILSYFTSKGLKFKVLK